MSAQEKLKQGHLPWKCQLRQNLLVANGSRREINNAINFYSTVFHNAHVGDVLRYNKNEISFIVHCANQEEIDYYWEKLSADPMAEQCGWLKDKYGVSWQIVPTIMEEMLKDKDKDKEKLARVTEAFLKMKKFDIKVLVNAYKGGSGA